jgi:hypothetical protein
MAFPRSTQGATQLRSQYDPATSKLNWSADMTDTLFELAAHRASELSRSGNSMLITSLITAVASCMVA